MDRVCRVQQHLPLDLAVALPHERLAVDIELHLVRLPVHPAQVLPPELQHCLPGVALRAGAPVPHPDEPVPSAAPHAPVAHGEVAHSATHLGLLVGTSQRLRRYCILSPMRLPHDLQEVPTQYVHHLEGALSRAQPHRAPVRQAHHRLRLLAQLQRTLPADLLVAALNSRASRSLALPSPRAARRRKPLAHHPVPAAQLLQGVHHRAEPRALLGVGLAARLHEQPVRLGDV
mmetsp:Transcript_15781/g.44750  ORF Transcript_15781/g.44750 Transcript_15781/m.44750 type:complete len:231 (-) Transcript_15781:2609-3301(-)